MSRDYRIGLAAGLALAGATLIGMATRPSWGPPPQPALPAQDDKALVLSTAQDTSPAPKTNQPQREKPEQIVKNLPVPHASDLSAKTEPNQAPRFHIVREGETLSGIAEQYYGSKESWRKILTANAKTIKNANKIAPGTKLIIP